MCEGGVTEQRGHTAAPPPAARGVCVVRRAPGFPPRVPPSLASTKPGIASLMESFDLCDAPSSVTLTLLQGARQACRFNKTGLLF